MSDIKTEISVEFFPPKTPEGAKQILSCADKIKDYISLVSITYGAGGTTRELTLNYANILKDEYAFNVMPHLTCVGHSKEELKNILQNFVDRGFKRIMALRGDPPKDSSSFVPHENGFAHANELIDFIKTHFPTLEIYCAGYPEKHPEASSMEDDIMYLKKKCDAGADYIISQLFFENEKFFDFVKKCREAGITKKIIAGILPALSADQAQNFCKMCGASLPQKLLENLKNAKDAQSARREGINWALNQIQELQNNVDGIHLYILNRHESALEIFSRLSSNK